MSFLDKAKEKAQQLATSAKEKVDDFKDTRKADDLLDDLGRVLYRQRTGRGEVGDEAAIGIDELETQSLAGHQADVAVEEESALRDVGGVRGMALRLSRAPEAQLDAPGVPAVPPAWEDF